MSATLRMSGQAPAGQGPARRAGRSAPVLEMLSVDKRFADGTQALAPLSLSVAPGEFVSLIGPSGCGKSTLLKLAANLLEPSDGTVRWWRGGFGEVGQPGRRLAFVFQDPTLMPWARVAANVRLPLDAGRVRRDEAQARVAASLDQVGLSHAARSYPRQLSGGMRMRVSIARALVTEPDLLLMDEPFGALDEFTRNRLDEDLARLSRERHLTTLFVTHSISEAVFLSSRIVVMAARPGRIFAEFAVPESGPRDEAFRLSDRFPPLCRDLSRLLAGASAAGGGAAP